MQYPTDRITHTMAFVTPVVEHWLEREIAKWVHPMKDRSDNPSHHERTLLPRSYISLQIVLTALLNIIMISDNWRRNAVTMSVGYWLKLQRTFSSCEALAANCRPIDTLDKWQPAQRTKHGMCLYYLYFHPYIWRINMVFTHMQFIIKVNVLPLY